MPILHGLILDQQSQQQIHAKVHVLDSGGRPAFPEGAILKQGPGLGGFYSSGEFVVDVPAGYTTLIVEKGTEFCPYRRDIVVNSYRATEIVISLERWSDLSQEGWYPGNTHIHYNENEDRSDERLRMDPLVHDLHSTALSHLQRWEIPYASNKYPLGLLEDFSSKDKVVCCGQENRHNIKDWEVGYGHILLLGINSPILPMSRGLLVDKKSPDYPPLCNDFDRSKSQGGVNIWCHNGMGMEAPVAAILGKIDAFNLFDPFLYSPEGYQVWYDLLNSGCRLPASTGSDWFICSNNRVYVHLQKAFSYENWLKGLKLGRTFITNGPNLLFSIDEYLPGDSFNVTDGQKLAVHIEWRWHQPIELVEVLWNGKVIESKILEAEMTCDEWEMDLTAQEDGWMAVRASSSQRDSFYQPIFAHTSPIWVQTGKKSKTLNESINKCMDKINNSLEWIKSSAKFENESQRSDIINLYESSKEAFRKKA
jgi:hypothetical protein